MLSLSQLVTGTKEPSMPSASKPRAFLVALLSLLILQPALLAQAQAPAIDTAAIDVIMQDALKAWQAPGAAIAIVKGDEVVYLKGFGVKEVGTSQAVTPDTLFAIA